MSSKLLEFALNKKRDVSTEENNGTEDADDNDARLQAELAMMFGEEPPAKKPYQPALTLPMPTNLPLPLPTNLPLPLPTNLPLPLPTNLPLPFPNNLQTLPPTLTAPAKSSPFIRIEPASNSFPKSPKKEPKANPNSMTDAEASVLALASNIKTEEVDANNNKTNGYTISMCPPTNRKFEQFFPPKSKEQLEREAANPPEPRGEDLSKPFKCEECGTRLKAKTTLELHISSKHKGVKRFACTLCDHKSAQKANLIVHMKASHNQTEKFECNFCDYRIDGKREIGNHVKDLHGRSIYGRGSEESFRTVYVTFIEP